jgi:IS5 family transposase
MSQAAVPPDFFRQPLSEMIDLHHPLAVLAERLPWAQIESALAPRFARQMRDGRVIAQDDLFGTSVQVSGTGVAAAGRPRLPIRLMASLLYLKHAYKLSDEELVERWAENVVWQHFSGMIFYEPRLPCDATQIGRFRLRLGEAGVEELLKATIDTAVVIKAIKPVEFERVIVDTTVQEKAIAHPVDSRLLEMARHKVVATAKRCGIAFKQTYAKEGKALRRKAGGYAHAKQYKRLRKAVKRQRTILGIVLRKVQRKIAQATQTTAFTLNRLTQIMQRAERIRTQQPSDKNKLYALHAPEVECIGKVQGAQALRIWREGQRGHHAQAGPNGGRTQLYGQPLRRPQPGPAVGASGHPDRGRGRWAQAGDRGSGLSRRGCAGGQPRR